jgi:hypothetical protein
MPTPKRGPADVSLMLRTMLDRPPIDEAVVQPTDRGLAVRQARALDRRAVGILADARETGVEIEYLGPQPLFTTPRLYEGEPNDWIIGPANQKTDLIVPKREQSILRRLANSDIEFPLIYVAHEVPKTMTSEIVKAEETAHTDIEVGQAQALVGSVPEPIEAVMLGEQLSRRSRQVMRGLRRTAVAGGAVVAGIAAAPVVIAGAALAGLSQLDPIVLGAVPSGEPREGQVAGWFVLCRWDW